jgi:hypothetical protein
MRCTGQHPIFGRYPAFALAAQEGRDALLNTGGDEHFGITKGHEHRTFGMFGEIRGDADLTHLIGSAAGWAHILFLYD